MIRQWTPFLLLALSFHLLFGCQQRPQQNHVLIISIDGFPARSLWNEDVLLPNLRKLALEGAWADAMIASNPTVTWPNHTSLVTGTHPERHHLLFNGLVIRDPETGTVRSDNDRDRAELVNDQVQTLYDVAYAAGLHTAEVNWPATRNAETLHDRFPDAPYHVRAMNPEFRRELMELGLITEEDMDAYWLGSRGAWSDHLWTEAARYLIRQRQPNLLLLHLLNIDSTHHRYGPDSQAGNTALSFVDTQIGQLLDALEEAGIRDRTTIFIVSDHGFVEVEYVIRPNVLLRQAGLLEADENGAVTSARVQVLSLAGSAMVYASDSDTREEDLRRARELFEGLDGVADIIEPDRYSEFGLPHPDDTDQVGELYLLAQTRPGYAFNNSAAGNETILRRDSPSGSHGYLNTDPLLETVFIASGYGIRPGTRLDEVDTRSVAPTAARLLGLVLETADGTVLEEILDR